MRHENFEQAYAIKCGSSYGHKIHPFDLKQIHLKSIELLVRRLRGLSIHLEAKVICFAASVFF